MKLRIYGNIKDTKTSQAIIDANIKLFLAKKLLQEVKSAKNGFYEIITEIDDSRVEDSQQLRVTVEKEGYQKQERLVYTTEESFNLDVELEPVAPIPEKPFNRLPLIIGGGVVLALLIGAMIAWLLLRPKDPKIIEFSLDSNSIDIGESATLSWDTKHALLLKIEPGLGEVEPKGDIKVKPARTTEYTLTVMNEKKKSVSKALTLEVVDKKDANELLDTSGTIQTKSGGLNIMGNVGIGTINSGENKLQVDGYTVLGGGIANSHFPWNGNGWAYVSGKGIVFREDAAGKYEERMRIADNGNIGIGITEPVYKLDVNGDSATRGNLILEGTNKWIFHTPDDGRTTMYMAPWNGVDNWIWGVLTMQRDGKVGIGTTRPTEEFHLAGSDNTPTLLIKPNKMGVRDVSKIRFEDPDGGTTPMEIQYIDDGRPDLAIIGGNVGIGTTSPGAKLDVAGDVRASNFPRLSDVKLKKNIAPIENALDKVSALRGVVFEWRTEEYPERGFDEGEQIGLIAQEVEGVLPSVVSEDNDGYKSLDYSRFSPVLIEAIKELKAEIEELREENADLKERIVVLEERY